jgi:hypothetical protein
MAQIPNSKYKSLTIPPGAAEAGAVEILRAAIINDDVYVAARRAFSDASRWGDLLADIARRIALLYSTEDTSLREQEFLVEIMEAFVADLGAKKIKSPAASKRRRKRPATSRATPRKKPTRAAAARKTVKRRTP